MSFVRFFRRGRWDDERARELASYLEHEADDNVARGMSPEAARAAARRKLGNTTLLREEIYEMNTIRLVDSVWQDVRFGVRLVRRNPGFAAVAVLSLALGIGANTAIFQLLDAVRLRQLPVARPGELAEISLDSHDKGFTGDFQGRHIALTYPLYQQIRRGQQGFLDVMAWGTATLNLSGGGERRPAEGLFVSGNFFDLLGVRAVVGRALTDNDDRSGCGSPAAVLGYGFWQRAYGGDPSVVGRILDLDGHPFDIVGVTPAAFFGVEVGRTFDVAIPICAEPIIRGTGSGIARTDFWWLAAIGRLKPGWTADRAQAQLASIAPGILRATLPQAYTADDTRSYLAYTPLVEPAGSGVSGLRRQYATPLWLLLAIAGTVLLIACVNLANLMLARASARAREVAIRLAIGASRGRVVRQLLAESLVVAAAGAVLGGLLAGWVSSALVAFLSTDSDRLFVEIATDWRVLAFTGTLAVGTCLVFGLTPALRATRTMPGAVMKGSGRGLTDSRERFGLRRALVVGQVALSLVLVVGALLFVRSLRNLLTLDPGFERAGVLVVRADLRRAASTPERWSAMTREVLEGIRALPGVDSAAETRIVPVSGGGWNDNIVSDASAGRKPKVLVDLNEISPGFFRALGAPLLAGRDFDAHDTLGSPKVAIVNEAFARQVLGEGSPIGRSFRFEPRPGDPGRPYQIVGLVGDMKYRDLRETFPPIAYFPASQNGEPPPFTAFLVRSRLPPASLTPALVRATARIDAAIVVSFQLFSTQLRDSLLRERLMATLSGFFGAMAGLLAVIGLYGVMSYMVARRRTEIGIRMALGADRADVVRMMMREAATLVTAGLAVGLILALGAAEAARALLFGLGPRDPSTLALSAAALAGVGVVATFVPALRAARLDPTDALREE